MKYKDNTNETFIIETPTPDDFERVKEICEGRFGDGYITRDEYEKWIRDVDYCKVAVINGKIVGVLYLMPEERSGLAKALKLDEDYVNSVSGGKGVIHCRCGALDKAYERRGIMYILLEVVIDNIKANGFGAIFAPAWTYNGFTPMAELLNRLGFEFVGERENLWYDLEGYKCIVCGGKCKCKASIYQKILI